MVNFRAWDFSAEFDDKLDVVPHYLMIAILFALYTLQ